MLDINVKVNKADDLNVNFDVSIKELGGMTPEKFVYQMDRNPDILASQLERAFKDCISDIKKMVFAKVESYGFYYTPCK